MLMDILAALFAFFIVDPARSAVDEALAAARVPPAIVAEARTCLNTVAPRLAAGAWNDPWWGISTVVNVTFGTAEWRDAVADVAPNCARALDSVLKRDGGARAEAV